VFSGAVQADSHSTDSLINQLENTKSDKEKTEILIEITNSKLNNLDHDSYKYLNQAQSILNKSSDDDKQAEINILYGEYWKIFGDYAKSVKYILKAIEHFEKINEKQNLAYCYTKIAESYRAGNEYNKAIGFLEKAESIIDNRQDSLLLAKVFNRKAAVYFEIKDKSLHKKSIEFAEKSIALLAQENHGLIINNLNIIAASDMYLSNYDLAEHHLLRALSLCKSHGDYYNYPTILSNLCDLYYQKGDLQKSLEYGLNCYEFRNEKRLEKMEPNLFQNLSRVYSALGDFKNANKFLVKTLDAKESIYSESKNRALLELQIKYETDKMEDEIATEKKYYFYQTIIFITLAALLVAFAVILFFRQRILKQKNTKIEEQNIKLEELNATKDKFFSIMAHDLRGPIGSFGEVIQILEKDYDSMDKNEAKEFLHLLKDSAVHLSALLNNLLTWSRSQRGVINYNPEVYNSNKIIEDNIQLLKIQADSKNIKLEYEFFSGYDIKADINMINTILRNLVSNAIKFTPEGGKIIVDADDSGDFIKFSVRDSGVGMPEDTINNLFRIDTYQKQQLYLSY